MKRALAIATLGLVLGTGSHAFAATFGFSGASAGGIGSATMDISIMGNTLTAIVDNTSPTTLLGGMGTNAPAITGFGFDLQDPDPALTGWSLTANAYDSMTMMFSPVTIDDQTGTGDWKMNDFVAGVSLDLLPTSGIPAQIKGGLYNPAAATGSGLAALPNFFTTATLTLHFDGAPILDPEAVFVRMQNVGAGGDGSLKLWGEPRDPGDPQDPPGAVPEPSTVVLLGSGLAGLGYWRMRGKAKTE